MQSAVEWNERPKKRQEPAVAHTSLVLCHPLWTVLEFLALKGEDGGGFVARWLADSSALLPVHREMGAFHLAHTWVSLPLGAASKLDHPATPAAQFEILVTNAIDSNVPEVAVSSSGAH